MEGCVPRNLGEDDLQVLVQQAKDFAMSSGLVIRSKDDPNNADMVNHAPITLFPSPVPRYCFYRAEQVQTAFNLLMHKVAHDHQFLTDTLKHTIEVDDFARQWWNIYITTYNEGISQPISLAMNRSDYMLDCADRDNPDPAKMGIKQIEFNTMASSFGGLSVLVTKYHKYLLETLGIDIKDEINRIPRNEAVQGLAKAVVMAWKKYGNDKAAVIFLVSETERNIYDQRHLEFTVRSFEPKIRVFRKSIQQVGSQGKLGPDKTLLLNDIEIAVVYLRMCYAPGDFQSQKDWDTLLMIERSRAISCPSARYFLAGTKKVQQELARPGVIEKYIDYPDVIQQMRSTFAGQFSLDQGQEGDKNIQLGIENPEKYVLKPQREGGGNNTFGEEIRNKLQQIQNTSERNAFILMERIVPPVIENYGIWAGKSVMKHSMISELGIYGSLVGTADDLYWNESHGHLLRTKILGTDEGGVATGYSCLDSPYLL